MFIMSVPLIENRKVVQFKTIKHPVKASFFITVGNKVPRYPSEIFDFADRSGFYLARVTFLCNSAICELSVHS